MTPEPLIYRFFKAPKESINLLKGIFECYEGECILSTVNREEGEVQLTIARDFAVEMDSVIADLSTHIPLLEISRENRSLGLF